jgi:phosphoglycolate phosphatase-like HAD superfamily hydrolase
MGLPTVSKLILFDIDGTLVLTGGAGGRAMSAAFRDVFGVPHPQAVAMDGRTDPWVVAEMARQCGLAAGVTSLRRFHDAYVTHLQNELDRPGPRKGVMPGVRAMLDALAARDDVFVALLTGNFRRGAQLKLEYFDLWRYFRCGAFGDAVMSRIELMPIAFEAVRACGGPSVDPGNVIVVGDTPLDVAAAAAVSARSVAVATGRYGLDELRASGAAVALTDLGDLAAVLDAFELEAM